ncbi:MAG: hypothetical protein C4305_09075, partial [Thermoleophilia bacterium]
QEIRQKMFVFEDLVLLDDRAIQRLLREVKMRDLALALKGASEGVRAKIFRNMSSRGAQALREEMEILGPQRLRVDGKVEVECERLRKEIERCQRLLANESFLRKAPPEVVAAERAKLARYQREREALGCADGP